MREKLNFQLLIFYYSITAIVIGVILVYGINFIDTIGLILIALMLMLLTYKIYHHLQIFNSDWETEKIEEKEYKKYIFYLSLSFIIFPIASFIIFEDLQQLHQGKRVMIWYLIILIHDYLGYWAAVLLVPFAGIFAIGELLQKLLVKYEPK